MKILSIVSNPATHDPRVYNEAFSLLKGGHEVLILGWDRKKTEKEMERDGKLRIIRVRNTPIMDALSYDLLRLPLWWILAYKKAIEIYMTESFDAIHCHDLDTLPIGVKLKKRLKIPLVYDAHEIWGYMISNDVPNFFVKHVMAKEKKLLKHVDFIITVNEPLKAYFRKISNKPIHIVMNAKSLRYKEYIPPKNEEFTLVYIGILIPSRFILEMMRVIGEIKDVRLIVGGRGKEKFVKKIEETAKLKKNLYFIGLVPQEKVIVYTCKSDAIVCMTSPNDPNSSRALTNKQFEAMVCGRPIIVTKGTYPGYFAEKNKVGIAVEYSEEGLREGILKLRDNVELREKLGKNALNAAIKRYNWEKQEKVLLKIYEEVQNHEKK